MVRQKKKTLKVKFEKEGIKERESKETYWKETKKKMWRSYRETEEESRDEVKDEIKTEREKMEKVEAIDNTEVERKIELELRKPNLIIKRKEGEREREEVSRESKCQIQKQNIIQISNSNSNLQSDVKEITYRRIYQQLNL